VDTQDNSFIDANEAYCNMLGYSRDEILKLYTSDVDAQETTEETQARVREMVTRGHGRFETRHRRKDGSLLEVEISAHYLAIKRGVFITFIRDISDRIDAEMVQDKLERNLRALLDATQESAILMERNGTILTINQIGAKRLHGSVDEVVGKNIYDLIPPDLAKVRRERNENSLLQGEPSVQEDEREGMRLLTTFYPVVDANGEINRVALYSADVTERRLLEAIEDLFATINQRVLEDVPPEQILEFICAQVVELFQLDLAWVGRKEMDGTVTMLTASGRSLQYAQRIGISGIRWDENPLGQGPTGTAIRTGQNTVFSVNDAAFQRWSGIAQEFGIQSVLGIPLLVHGVTFGAFTMYSHVTSAFEDASVMKRLVGIASRVSMALEAAMDMQQIRLLSTALSSAANAVLVTDAQGRIQWINAAFTRLSGYSPEEAIGQTPRLLKSGQQEDVYYQTLWQSINKGEVWCSETVEKNKEGSLYTVMQTITPLTDINGKITHFIAIHEDITEQKRTQERIKHMAHYDTLTGLPNRALFFDRLRYSLSKAKRTGNGVALLYMDLDGFKQVNDRMGHHAGDLLLIEVASRLAKCLRESDTVARLGGDEFTIVLNDVHKNEYVSAVATKIIETISVPFDLEGQQVRIGISIGVARYTDEASNEDCLIKCADQAMYEAKMSGKNTYRFGVSNLQ
jgi:diguanylate cyclase (GGDEF)-like protein/PAS domain S-box-containing protein